MAESRKIDQSPSVSVIINTYNRASLIGRAIESVLAQTYTDFELIIVDDGSTDNTCDVVATYQDPRIIYEWVENGERSRARNIGINLSRGKYVAFLDSDDWYLPNKLLLQVAALESSPEAGLVLGGWMIVDEVGEKIQENRPWEKIATQPSLEEWLFAPTMSPITILIKKQWLERVGGFDTELFVVGFPEDVELCIRLSLAGCPVVWSEEIIAVVLAHGTNSLRNWPSLKQGRLNFLHKLFSNPQFIKNLSISKEEVFAGYHLALAWQAYDYGFLAEGKQELSHAVELNPKLCERNFEIIQTTITGYAKHYLCIDPINFVRQVFQNLPPSLVHFRRYRREVLGKVWMSRAWVAHPEGRFALARQSVLHAIWYRPSYLKDRGVLSILFQSLLARRVWQLTRPVLRWRTAGE